MIMLMSGVFEIIGGGILIVALVAVCCVWMLKMCVLVLTARFTTWWRGFAVKVL
jgi:uncharacterized membrane protein